jgi:very-short-patch-repair endonuclease
MTDIAPFIRATARRLRADMTAPEKRLWWHLRDLNRRLGTHFRRQAPIGRFIVDFADFGRRIVVEVDGDSHGVKTQVQRDSVRDAELRAQGFAVLRLSNEDVMANPGGAVQVVLDALNVDPAQVSPPPHPSPTGGEGGAPHLDDAPRMDRVSSPPPRGEGMGVGGTCPERVTP